MQITLKNLQKDMPVRAEKIRKQVLKLLKGEKVKKTGWINICFVDNGRISEFNSRFLGDKRSTDVLAFDLSEKKEPGVLRADIIVSAQKASEQSKSFKTTPDYELSLYVIHGILHILGYDDHTGQDTAVMRRKEKEYVN